MMATIQVRAELDSFSVRGSISCDHDDRAPELVGFGPSGGAAFGGGAAGRAGGDRGAPSFGHRSTSGR